MTRLTEAKIIVLPSRNLRDLIVRAVARRRVGWNYCVCFRDVNGFGVSVAVVDWLKPGQTYINAPLGRFA